MDPCERCLIDGKPLLLIHMGIVNSFGSIFAYHQLSEEKNKRFYRKFESRLIARNIQRIVKQLHASEHLQCFMMPSTEKLMHDVYSRIYERNNTK